MTKVYECRIAGWDELDQWTQIQARSLREAAEIYAEKMDAVSFGELFETPGADELHVMVRREELTDTFTVSFEYAKTFTARKQDLRKVA